MLNLPNILTLARMATLPILIWLLFVDSAFGLPAVWLAFGLYVLSALTDFLDGYLARKMKLVTAFGTFLDPISDKVFVATLLIALVATGTLSGLWIIPVIIIMSRELLVSGLREYLGPHNVQLPVTNLAKWKTTAQMISLGLLIIGTHMPYTLEIGQWALALAALLTVITGWGYLKAGLDHMAKMP